MNPPRSTYRIQLHQQFNFNDLEEHAAYFAKLGIGTLYVSPIYKSVRGSIHGYDWTDAARIDPGLGTHKQLLGLKKQLRKLDITWLQDIVPNHMAYHQDNAWLMSILEHGSASPYRYYFDTSLSSSFMKGKLMVPVLKQNRAESILTGEVFLSIRRGRLYLTCSGRHFPVCPSSYLQLLSCIKADQITPGISELSSHLRDLTEKEYHVGQWEEWRRMFFSNLGTPSLRKAVKEAVGHINANPALLSDLIAAQHYQLCHWEETDHRINFRRFFTVSNLICLNVHDQKVFDDVHALTKKLVDQSVFDGLRIDHVDGLYNPSEYLRNLRRLCGPDTYIVVEKILGEGEKLPGEWPVQGTTGYDFLSLSNNLFTDPRSKRVLTHYYEKRINTKVSLKQQQIEKKALILSRYMEGEASNLYQYFVDLDLYPGKKKIPEEKVKEIISAFLVYFPVYRLYEEQFPLQEKAYKVVRSVWRAILRDAYADPLGVRMMRRIFRRAQYGTDPGFSRRAACFLSRCMQFTGPLMAKGVEDTLMYTYHRLIGRNDVGDHPANFGMEPAGFHKAMKRRQKKWPLTLNATATHDTKRGEDARARLHVLAAIPDRWIQQVEHWETLLHYYEGELPHPNDIYFIYQALTGSYPMPGQPDDDFKERLHSYLEKYLREGKQYSDWTNINTPYEELVKAFSSFLLDKNGRFYGAFMDFLKETADFGIVNSLAQLVLKFTSPGIPDLYQGSELWDLSFVDPDNRRPVDYSLRMAYLEEMAGHTSQADLSPLWADRYTGKIKLRLLQVLLQLRKDAEELFLNGEYIGLEVKGVYRRHILAFARKYRDEWVVTAVPLYLAGAEGMHPSVITGFDWKDTHILLPVRERVKWRNILASGEGEGKEVKLNDIFSGLPLAVLPFTVPPKTRTAGILMHITSLPSAFGIGDMGENAFRFADRLRTAGQYWWQMLPVGPVSAGQLYSPYSIWSAMAGNPLLISPEVLAAEGLLEAQELKDHALPATDEVDYDTVVLHKNALLDKAFSRAEQGRLSSFRKFCREEKHWLDDYTLFVVLRKEHADQPWYSWETPYKLRNPGALRKFAAQHTRALELERWKQYQFYRQWKSLKAYCHRQGISLLGDIPIYVSYDSADVWADPHLFSLNDDRSLRTVAGVPPDYFNSQGQLWGMPVFNWPAHQEEGYRWWIRRISLNRQLFDKIRLDHFRAFASYWEVPAGEKTAMRGTWKPGPGKDLFNRLTEVFGDLPFVAEDLGEIDDTVHSLRKYCGLPGMKVLQFSFGGDPALSPHAPHHHEKDFFVYTGTHDNDTLLGWLRKELDKPARKKLGYYCGVDINEDNIHDVMIRMAYASVAQSAIIPMQDVLKLDENNRMNKPGTTTGNWTWRMCGDEFSNEAARQLLQYAQLYNR